MKQYWECSVCNEVCSVCHEDSATCVLQTIWQSNYSNIGLFGGNIGLFGRNTGLFWRYTGNALFAMRTVLRVFCKESGNQITADTRQHRAILQKCRAFWWKYRAFWRKCRALVEECRALFPMLMGIEGIFCLP